MTSYLNTSVFYFLFRWTHVNSFPDSKTFFEKHGFVCWKNMASWDVYIVQCYKNQYCTNLISQLISQAYRLLTLQCSYTAGKRSHTLFQFIHWDGSSKDPWIPQQTSLSTFFIRLRNIFMPKWLQMLQFFKNLSGSFPPFQNENVF